MKPKRIILEAADHCATGQELGYEILMNVWSYLHYGDRWLDYVVDHPTTYFWDVMEIEYGTESRND